MFQSERQFFFPLDCRIVRHAQKDLSAQVVLLPVGATPSGCPDDSWTEPERADTGVRPYRMYLVILLLRVSLPAVDLPALNGVLGEGHDLVELQHLAVIQYNPARDPAVDLVHIDVICPEIDLVRLVEYRLDGHVEPPVAA